MNVNKSFLRVSQEVSSKTKKFPVSSAGNCTRKIGNSWHNTLISLVEKSFLARKSFQRRKLFVSSEVS